MGCSAFARHYSRNHIRFLFLRLLRCFTSPGVASPSLCVQEGTTPYYWSQVTPFGNLRVNACVQLTEAYRSLSRPSSPVGAKASTLCPFLLDSLFSKSGFCGPPVGRAAKFAVDRASPVVNRRARFSLRSSHFQDCKTDSGGSRNRTVRINSCSFRKESSHGCQRAARFVMIDSAASGETAASLLPVLRAEDGGPGWT